MKSLVLALSLFAVTLFVPASSFAQTTNLEPGVCVSVYGGGVVCGAKHEVVPTALGDNLLILGGAFLVASAALFLFSRKLVRPSVVKKNSSHISG